MERKLLIVDDSEGIVSSLSLLFEGIDGFVVVKKTPVLSVKDAILAIEETNPDIILLDHELSKGGGEGLEILQEIKDKGLKDAYRRNKIFHFPGKNILEIKKCISGNCGCISALISFLP